MNEEDLDLKILMENKLAKDIKDYIFIFSKLDLIKLFIRILINKKKGEEDDV